MDLWLFNRTHTELQCAPLGKNKLGSMVKDMCSESGIELKTNHSLRATGASAMFHNQVPEKIIQDTTGHRSLDALRKYEKTSIQQHQAVSRVLMSGEMVPYGDQPGHTSSTDQASNPAVSGIHTLFGNVTNSTISNITVNINTPTPTPPAVDLFDQQLLSLDLDL